MAQLVINLPDAALAHAEDCAKTLGFASTAEWCLEWLTNSAKMVEKQRKQKEVTKLETRINNEVDALYEDGSVSSNPTISLPSALTIATPTVVGP